MEFFRYGREEVEVLAAYDPQLGQAMECIGPIERPVIPDLFTALVSSIVHQQISNKAAATVWGRVVDRFGPIGPEGLAGVSLESIQQCGMSLRKAGYIQSIARAVTSGELDLPGLHDLPDAEVIDRLSRSPGSGCGPRKC